MEKKKKILKRIVAVFGVLVLLAAVLATAMLLYVKKYYKSDVTMIDAIVEIMDGSVNSYADSDSMVFVPSDHNIKAMIIFYPGGKVEYTAYSTLMYRLADRGYLCVLLKMPGNLAFLDMDAAAETLEKQYDRLSMIQDVDWYIMGHSLGGVAASSYLEGVLNGDKPTYHGRGPEGEYRGIIFCGSYTAEDYTDNDIRLLSIYGTEDGVLNREAYEASKELWPEDSAEYIIHGGNHANFGSYGEQEGDGTATLTCEQQQDYTAALVDEWIYTGN